MQRVYGPGQSQGLWPSGCAVERGPGRCGDVLLGISWVVLPEVAVS